MRATGAVPARGRPAFAPLANGLGADAGAPGQLAGGLARAGDLGAHGRRGAGVGVDPSIRPLLPSGAFAQARRSARRTSPPPNAPDPNTRPHFSPRVGAPGL